MRVLYPLRSMLGLTMITGSLGACSNMASSPPAAQQLALANPATVHCISMGGESISHRTSGGEYSTCRLRDGSELEEWRFYRQSFPHLY